MDKPTEGGLPRGLEGLGMGLGADGAPLKDVAAVVASMNRGGDRAHPPAANPVSLPYFTSNTRYSDANSLRWTWAWRRKLRQSSAAPDWRRRL